MQGQEQNKDLDKQRVKNGRGNSLEDGYELSRSSCSGVREVLRLFPALVLPRSPRSESDMDQSRACQTQQSSVKHLQLADLTMAMATTDRENKISPENRNASLFRQIDDYHWASDGEFQAGLHSILGSDPSPEQAAYLTLRARCFYFARCVQLCLIKPIVRTF